MKRLFVAFEMEEALRRSLSEEVAQFRRSLGEKAEAVRWVGAERYHMTAVFLGDTPEERIPKLKEILEATELASTETVTLGAPMVFPKPRSPRVLVRALSAGYEPLQRIAGDLRGALEQEGIDFDKKPFRPHVTVGYLRKRRTSLLKEITRFWVRQAWPEEPPGRVTNLILFESVRRPDGPIHTALWKEKLT